MKIILLSTWFPYPPNQGSKIRAYHVLRALSAEHEVGLLSFKDVEIDNGWLEHISDYCAWVEIIPRDAFAMGKLGSIFGLFSTRPRAMAASYSKPMSSRLKELARTWQPDLVFALTINTAPYAAALPPIMRVVDVDNLLARMLYEEYMAENNLVRRIRRYLAFIKLQRYERALFSQFDLALVTSLQDRQNLMGYVPLESSQIGVVPNGVDLDSYHFRSDSSEGSLLAYTGALTYFANFDAMQYFLEDIFPTILAQVPDTRLEITGSTMGVDLESLPNFDQVTFTGYVDDIREILKRARLCIVPLRKGAGTRLKILEAMAAGVPVVSTSKGAEGLEVEHEVHLLVADHPQAFARETVRLLNDQTLRNQLARNARQLVEEKYDWTMIRKEIGRLIPTAMGQARYDH